MGQLGINTGQGAPTSHSPAEWACFLTLDVAQGYRPQEVGHVGADAS